MLISCVLMGPFLVRRRPDGSAPSARPHSSIVY